MLPAARLLGLAALSFPLLTAACVGEPVEPARAPDHPANPRAQEVPMLATASASPAASAPSPPAAPAHDHHHMGTK